MSKLGEDARTIKHYILHVKTPDVVQSIPSMSRTLEQHRT